MPRWNNNLESNCRNVMDNVIKNIKSELYQQLFTEILATSKKNNKKIIAQWMRARLDITSSLSKHTKRYWLARGWNNEEAYVKAKEHKITNCKSVYAQKTWLEKINPATGTYYTIEEADFERNSRRPIRKEYWVKQGYLEIEAAQLASDLKIKNNKKGADASKQSHVRAVTSKRCVEYYTARGYSEAAAKELVSANQKHFSKNICIEKYGTEKGFIIWQTRQDKWQATLNAKSNEEKARINRLKLSKGITVSAAEHFIFNEITKLNIFATQQFTLFSNNKKQYVYDIVVGNKIIEYNGDFWHCNPAIYDKDFINTRTKIKASDKWAADSKKIQFAKDRGYEVLVIWESNFKQNKEEVTKQCIQFLTQ